MNRLRTIVLAQLGRTRGALALAALCMAGATVAELAAPWPLKILFDHVLIGVPLPAALDFAAWVFALGPWAATATIAAAMFALTAVGGVCLFVQIHITSRLGHELAHALRTAAFAGLARMPLAVLERHRAGELITKLASDTATLKDLVSDWALTILAQLLLAIGVFAIMWMLNWRLALVVAASLPVLAAALVFLNRRIRKSLVEQRRQEGRLAARVHELLGAIAMVQAFGRGAHEVERFRAASERNLADGVRTSRSTAAVARAIALVAGGVTALTVLVGTAQVLEARMSPGDLLVFLAYLRSLYKPLRGLGKLSVKVSRARVSAARIAELLDESPEEPAAGVEPLTGALEFEAVSFGYHADRRVLDAVSFAVAPGERVAIVGASGAGKSTIAKLILRLYEPDAGAIRIGGCDIRSMDRQMLRERIGVVLQDTVLLGATIRENIAYGKVDASDAEIERAAGEAHAAEFIERLPERYATVVGERGATLSGGERQRLCLARALVKRPAILILDEPTAAIDPVSRRLVRRAMSGRTTIVISHELDRMAEFDRILVLDQGRIAEAGSHEALMRLRGRYFRMNAQVA